MNFTSPLMLPKHLNQSPLSKSNSSKVGKFLNLNSSIRKYLNINIEKDTFTKPPLEFNAFAKTPLKKEKSSIFLKKENTSPLNLPHFTQEAQKNNVINEANFSGLSKASYESYAEDINFDHCQYIEIMHNLQKGPIKLYSKGNNKTTKTKSLKLIEKKILKRTEKRDISDFAGAGSKMINNNASRKLYMCKYCQMGFAKPCALGGHMSKLHKGRSKFFKKRKEKREMRETERQRNTFFKTIFKQNC